MCSKKDLEQTKQIGIIYSYWSVRRGIHMLMFLKVLGQINSVYNNKNHRNFIKVNLKISNSFLNQDIFMVQKHIWKEKLNQQCHITGNCT